MPSWMDDAPAHPDRASDEARLLTGGVEWTYGRQFLDRSRAADVAPSADKCQARGQPGNIHRPPLAFPDRPVWHCETASPPPVKGSPVRLVLRRPRPEMFTVERSCPSSCIHVVQRVAPCRDQASRQTGTRSTPLRAAGACGCWGVPGGITPPGCAA